MMRKQRRWDRLASGLYIPPLIGRLLPRVPRMGLAGGYPCCCEEIPDCGCGVESGDTPSQLSVTLPTPWYNNNCVECTSFTAGPFLLNLTTNDTDYEGNCFWKYTFPLHICEVEILGVLAPGSFSDGSKILCVLAQGSTITGDNQWATWSWIDPEDPWGNDPLDCSTIDYETNSFGHGEYWCFGVTYPVQIEIVV